MSVDNELIKEQAVTRQLILDSLKKLDTEQERVKALVQLNANKLLIMETEAKTNHKYGAWMASIVSSVVTAVVVAFILGKV